FGMLGLMSVDMLRADGQGDSKVKVQDRAAPPVIIGVMGATRFIAKKVVSQKVAKKMVEKGKADVMAPNRAVAKNIAGKKPIREFNVPQNATEKTKIYTHYHTHDRNGSHVWYGKPRKDW
ncbi:hypothetical protein, partial [Helicobacter baculiformis]